MKNKKKFVFLPLLYISTQIFCQINHFNFYKPYQTTVCCPLNVYGLELQMNYIIYDINTAELQIPVGLYWGFFEDFEVGIQFSGSSKSYQDKVEKGINDVLIGIKHTFLKEIKEPLSTLPTVSLELGLSIPTGDYKKSFGTGGIGITLFWLIEKQILLRTKHYFDLNFTLGYKYNTVNPDNYRFGESLFYIFGSNFDIKENFRFSFGVKGENKKSDLKDNVEKGNEKFESYIYCGISYDLDIYHRFFCAANFGITEEAKDIIFNIGMMY